MISRHEVTFNLVMSGTEDFIEATVVFICAEYGKCITELLEFRGSVPYFSNFEFGNRTFFHFSLEEVFCDQLVSAIVMAIAAAIAIGGFSARPPLPEFPL